MTFQTQRTKATSLFIAIAIVLIASFIGTSMAIHVRRLHVATEDGLRREVRDNDAGIREMRAAIPTEIANISAEAALLKMREAGQVVDGSQIKNGLAVMALTDANWQAACVTGAVKKLDYATVARFAGAYFEQARLAQLQTSTLEVMMSLTSTIGSGAKLQFLSPQDARVAEIEALSLVAHLRMMLRMSDGVQEAYKTALSGQS